MAHAVRSKHARRRSQRPNTLKRVRRRITVHHHRHRRYAGTGVVHRLAVRRAAHGRAKAAAHHGKSSLHRRRRAGTHHAKRASRHLKRKALHAQRHRHVAHRKVHRRRGYHLKHKRHLNHKIHRRKGLHHPHKGWHGPRHFKHHHGWSHHGWKHPHRGWTHKKPPAPAPLSAASYLSMF